ncbi:putative annexin [Polychaeton citri CBS 116435]|uniref:Annexin n=1 Tax=Polychaeton citri CBS 116435 TaxID=1314669 RepID=A0A9P4UNV3_9PEZI|nr:putative annexin [Polychaeton citri CBS 116435]
MSHTADELRKAMKGFGTNENVLIQTLAPLDAIQIENVKRAFRQRHNRDLYRDIKSETSGYFRDGLLAIVRGPLEQDCVVLRDAVEGLGTKESALNEVLLARTNADLNAIKQHYRHMFKDTVEEVVRKDLSMKTERLFDMVMAACRNEESSPAFPNEIERDVEALYFATEGKTGTDQMTVCQILSSRSNGQIRAIAHAYEHKYHRKLQAVIKKEFSGHMEEALLFMLNAAVDPAKHDADLLEESMKGMGTKDAALVRRIVMIHWDKARLHSCKQAYAAIYKQSLAKRIRGETRGDYEKLMVACIGER